MVKIDMEAIRRLSVPDRVRLMNNIWDTLQPSAAQLPITDEQRELVRRRLAEHREDPDSTITLAELTARLESR